MQRDEMMMTSTILTKNHLVCFIIYIMCIFIIQCSTLSVNLNSLAHNLEYHTFMHLHFSFVFQLLFSNRVGRS